MLEVSATIVCAGNLLLEHSVLLGVDVENGILSVVVEVLFELLIFSLLPFVKLILFVLEVFVALLLLFVSCG